MYQLEMMVCRYLKEFNNLDDCFCFLKVFTLINLKVKKNKG
jgi:hypothetical protein